MTERKLRLKDVLDALRAALGEPAPPPTRDVWEALLRTNAAYLVDDDRRDETYRSLSRAVGTTPRRLLSAEPREIERAIERGGMQPAMRTEKLRECARLALDCDLPRLLREMDARGDDASIAEVRKALRRFPGIGEPGADELLLLAGRAKTLALESNGLRVLTRLGLVPERKSYATAYRDAHRALVHELPEDSAWLLAARGLLRAHGQSICKRTQPHCAACTLRKRCPSATAGS